MASSGLRKSSATLSAAAGSCSIHPLSGCHNCSSTLPQCYQIASDRRADRRFDRSKRRPYATVASSHEHNDPSSDQTPPWPVPPDPRRLPTPYDIFNQSRNQPYSKRRFYELVKLYHPDRSVSSEESCQPEVRLERYRLVIAANAILSDPSRRAAYDSTGHGWSIFRNDLPGSDASSEPRPMYTTYHRWRRAVAEKYAYSFEDDPMFNATWEDWERWYERQRDPEGVRNRSRGPWAAAAGYFTADSSTPRQAQVYASNYVFVSLIALLTALAGISQATRASTNAQSYRERATRKSDEVSRSLNETRDGARDAVGAGSSKRERIAAWVRARDDYVEGEPDGRLAATGGLEDGNDDGVCASGQTASRDELPYWKRQPEEWEREGRRSR